MNDARSGAPGRLPSNVMQFARLLRRAGLRIGTPEVLAAQQAMALIDLGARTEVKAALRATLLHREADRDLFEKAFTLFWRNPARLREEVMEALAAATKAPTARPAPGSRRIEEAFAPPDREKRLEEVRRGLDVALTASARERLQTLDFAAMSAAEIAAAKAEIRRLTLPLERVRTRRRRADPKGQELDLRATIRDSLRQGGEIVRFSYRSRTRRPPPLVILCDISGSMERYTQILLLFAHAVTGLRERVHVFLFGTRLSNVTRPLQHRDPEVAFQMMAEIVPDWSGGTRIGEALATFNRFWARRVLGQGAVVLLVSDGLDRDGARDLAANMDRLHRSCRRLIWLNPLLRWEGFSPRSQGIRAMLPHVDEFRPVHNLASLKTLIATLSRGSRRRESDGTREIRSRAA